jgi:two-component system chemotaxis sensor kinase CheA
MTESSRGDVDVFEQVAEAFSRLDCALLVGIEGGEGVAQVAAELSAMATLVEQTGDERFVDWVDSVRTAALALTPHAVASYVAAIQEDWDACTAAPDASRMVAATKRVAVDAAADHSAAPAPVDAAAELEMLAADPELAGMFFAEALDHLGTIEARVLQLETTPDDKALLDDVFRPFHTVKGNAGALGVSSVQELAHSVEDLLDRCRSGRHRAGAAEIEVILRGVDLLTSMIRDLEARLSGQPGTDSTQARRQLIAEVERLINHERAPAEPGASVAEAPEPERIAGAVPSADAGAGPAGVPRASAEAAGQGSVKVDTRKLDNLVDMVGELVVVQAIIQEHPALAQVADERMTRHLAQMKRITSDLQRTAMSVRLVPIRQTFQKMARLVRDLSRKSGKPIDLVLSGEETELDRKVVEEINDPLMHMVRNSIDHGIEAAEARARAGKRPAGQLSLSAYHQGGSIVIAIADDGGGLDTERILAKAVTQGLVPAGATLAPADVHQLIFHPGFSTAEKITEISGRGVGMDVVKRNIEALRGRIDIQSTPGQGTTFLIKLPLTLAIVDGVLAQVGGHRYVIPTFSVRESFRPSRAHIHTLEGRPCLVQVREHLLPFVRLSDVFGIDDAIGEPWEATMVIIEDDGRRMGLVIDQLLGKQEVVIKSVRQGLGDTPGIAGGAILGDGQVGLIVDAGGIFAFTRREPALAA